MTKPCPHGPLPSQPTHLNSSSFLATLSAAAIASAALRRPRPRFLLCVIVASALLIAGGTARVEPVPAASQNVAVTVDPVATFVTEASQRFGIPASWIEAVMQAESRGNVRALSTTGAMGLMQIRPKTWTALRARYGFGADPYDAHDNILAGAAYIRELHDRYGTPGFLAAYNAGPVLYEDHLATGRPLPVETQAYVAALAPMIASSPIGGTMVAEAAMRSWTEAPLFATRDAPIFPPSPSFRSGRPITARTTEDWTALARRSVGLLVVVRPQLEQAP
jgi:soluble lytic murein transglycosylase-like protein